VRENTDPRVRVKDRSIGWSARAMRAPPALSPNRRAPARRRSTCIPRSVRRLLLNDVGMRNGPVLSSSARAGCGALGSRVSWKVVVITARGRSTPQISVVALTSDVTDRWARNPASRPNNDSRSSHHAPHRGRVAVVAQIAKRAVEPELQAGQGQQIEARGTAPPARRDRSGRINESDASATGTWNVDRSASPPDSPLRNRTLVGVSRSGTPATATCNGVGIAT
jgi:hypothetical protein